MPARSPEAPFKLYRGARVVVFGASGFIGRWVARLLCEQGAQLTLPVRNPRTAMPVFGKYRIEGDVLDLDLETSPQRLGDLLRSLRPSIVFNLAAYGINRDQRNEARARAINTEFPAMLCEAMADMKSGGWRGLSLVHAGSALEYGAIGGDLAEDSPARPDTLYGQSKLAGTTALSKRCRTHGVLGATARLFSVFGPGESKSRLLPSLLAAARSNRALQLTDGRQQRDFTYVGEAAEGLLRIGVSELPPGSVVNLATGQLVSVREFALTAAELLSMPGEQLEFGRLAVRKEEMEHAPVSIARLRQATAWAPALTVREGIGRTIDFMRAGSK